MSGSVLGQGRVGAADRMRMRAWQRLRGFDGSSQPASKRCGLRVRAGRAAVQPSRCWVVSQFEIGA